MQRKGTLVVVAHCLLNANSKVKGLAPFEGAFGKILSPFLEAGAGLMQLPCPECTFLGMRRWGMTSEQYDIPAFHKHSRKLLEPYVYQIRDALETGYRVFGVLGVEGSPSCGVSFTCQGYQGGSLGDARPRASRKEGPGVFTRILREMLREQHVDLPFVGVYEAEPDMEALKELIT